VATVPPSVPPLDEPDPELLPLLDPELLPLLDPELLPLLEDEAPASRRRGAAVGAPLLDVVVVPPPELLPLEAVPVGAEPSSPVLGAVPSSPLTTKGDPSSPPARALASSFPPPLPPPLDPASTAPELLPLPPDPLMAAGLPASIPRGDSLFGVPPTAQSIETRATRVAAGRRNRFCIGLASAMPMP
jgi:hypothetical protein